MNVSNKPTAAFHGVQQQFRSILILCAFCLIGYRCRSIPIELPENTLAHATFTEQKRLRDLNEAIRKKTREKQVRSAIVVKLKQQIEMRDKLNATEKILFQGDVDLPKPEEIEKRFELEKGRALVTTRELSFITAEYEYMKAKIILRGSDDQDTLGFYGQAVTDAYNALATAQVELKEKGQ